MSESGKRDEVVTVGVISDTHGLLRAEALGAFQGSSAIIHAGDVGDAQILLELERIAPVTAVRGNIDTAPSVRALPQTNVLEIANVSIFVLHKLEDLDLDPVAAGFAAVIFGHSHQPVIEHRKNVLFFNPGSAGPRRFNLPIAVGKLTVAGGKMKPQLIKLG